MTSRLGLKDSLRAERTKELQILKLKSLEQQKFAKFRYVITRPEEPMPSGAITDYKFGRTLPNNIYHWCRGKSLRLIRPLLSETRQFWPINGPGVI